MRHYAGMSVRRLRTADYDEAARARLADAVTKAREADGHMWRTTFAREHGIKSIRSLEMLEHGEPGVGQSILFKVGRALTNWTQDTPKVILEGGPIPPLPEKKKNSPIVPALSKDVEAREIWDDVEREIYLLTSIPEEDRWQMIIGRRKGPKGEGPSTSLPRTGQ